LARPRVFVRPPWYREAYRLALELKEKHPEWGYGRIAAIISERLSVEVPEEAVHYWVARRRGPEATPLRLNRETLPAVAYLVGVACGYHGGAWDPQVFEDREFLEYFAAMYEEATGEAVSISGDLARRACEEGWLRGIWETELWKTFAEMDPVNWLKGLYDVAGDVTPDGIVLTVSDPELLRIAERQLRRLGLNPTKE